MYGLNADSDISDPSVVLSATIQQAKDNVGTAGLWMIAILLGVGFLIYRPGRR